MQMPEFMQDWWVHLSDLTSPALVLGTTPEHFRSGPNPTDDPLDEGCNMPLSEVWEKLPEPEQQLIFRALLITPSGSWERPYVEVGPLTVWCDGAVGIDVTGLTELYDHMVALFDVPGRKDSPWHQLEAKNADA